LINILHISPDQAMSCSGVNTVVTQLAERLSQDRDDYRVRIFFIGAEIEVNNSNIQFDCIDQRKFGTRWFLLPRAIKKIIYIVKRHNISLIHIHGVWRITNLAGLIAANNCKIPAILSSHGMLEPWLWEKQGLFKKIKKKIYFKLFLRRTISKNVLLHAITDREKDNLINLFPANKIVTIPNAIHTSVLRKIKDLNISDNFNKTILFIGRIHPVKGIEILINAFKNANMAGEWKLLIIGPFEDVKYSIKLRNLVKKYNIEHHVDFLGPIINEKKFKLIAQSWVLVAPSYTEVIGMVNLESALCKTPSITTYETGLLDWEEGGGLLIHPDVQQLTSALINTTMWTIEERKERGVESCNHVILKYSMDNVFAAWKKVYEENYHKRQ